MQENLIGATIHITGVVQGVGFRPFVYNLAGKFALSGWVRNTSAGVDIAVDGQADAVHQFASALRTDAPPLASIDELETLTHAPAGYRGFSIQHSHAIEGGFQPISPDISICPDCLSELLDPQDRRYRYPFINCTNCGPRFTIIQDIPYDRPKTTMAPFPMCPECGAEYQDPTNRRFHAQPVACPVCGPHLWLEYNSDAVGGPPSQLSAEKDALTLQTARQMLASGKILAVKGLGGFHLVCDATNSEAVAELRRRKMRTGKPFALMAYDLQTVEEFCYPDAAEKNLLSSIQHPIVILQKRKESPAAEEVAPAQDTLGFMLPYTPLHVLLLEPQPGFPSALVMTSANLSEEPIAARNEEARQRLASLADAFLMHNREIHIRCDDSVMRKRGDGIYPLRRARGYAPMPLSLGWSSPSVFAAGTELKNTFCLTRERYAFLSHHIGDLQNYETLQAYEHSVRHYENLFRIRPELIAHDLHPDYLATRFAAERAANENLPLFGVQHHHAHIAACMAENRVPAGEPVIGIAFDGTGYGDDGAIWGGEILLTTYAAYQRSFHLRYVPLAGGDLAVQEPFRLALAWLDQAAIPWDEARAPFRYLARQPGAAQKISALQNQIRGGVNSISTSSMGRLFDAAASLLDICHKISYEAQAAIELEAKARHAMNETGHYEFILQGAEIDPRPVFLEILRDISRDTRPEIVAARFHNSVAEMVLQACLELRKASGVTRVALSGGVWQNMILLAKTEGRLRQASFEVLVHQKVPTNDGGVALGQAVTAIQRYERGER